MASEGFEIPTDGYYKIKLTLKGSTIGKSPKYETKEYKSETVTLTLNENKKSGTETIKNDC
jgi:hypothetical protein